MFEKYQISVNMLKPEKNTLNCSLFCVSTSKFTVLPSIFTTIFHPIFNIQTRLMVIRIFNRVQSLWRGLYMRGDSIIHNTENGFSVRELHDKYNPWLIVISSSRLSSHFPLLRKWDNIVLWYRLYAAKSIWYYVF